MTFTVEVERVLSRDAVGATHAAAARGQVVLVDVSRTHWNLKKKKKSDSGISDQAK